MIRTHLSHRTLVVAAAATVALAACGSDPAPLAAPATPAPTTAAPAAAAAATSSAVGAAAGTTELGEVLVGTGGLTLYGFTNDTEASSTCTGACADAWPPVIVDDDWTVAPDLDLGIFATTVRDDGQQQLVAGKWPLYFFAGDAAPGDINGQGSGDVWFAVDLDGILIEDLPGASAAAAEDAAAPVGVGTTSAGDVLVDADGLSLYGFTDDVDGQPTCEGACADAWPPVIVDSAELPAGLDPEIFSTVQRPDGTFQLVAGVWPLYLFAGDAAPGDINGQGSGDVWFLTAPDGSLIGAGAAAAAEEGSSGY